MNDNVNQKDSQTQCQQILAHLESGGTITPMEALDKFGCFRLASRICDLKRLGHTIVSHFETNPDNGKKYKRYQLQGL